MSPVVLVELLDDENGRIKGSPSCAMPLQASSTMKVDAEGLGACFIESH